MVTWKAEEVGGVDDEKLLSGYNVLFEWYPKSPDFTTIQSTHVTKLHLCPINLYKQKKNKIK